MLKNLLSPKKFFFLSKKIQPWLSLVFAICLGYGLIGGLYLAPPDYLQGDGFRIIYLHAPAAFLSLFIYSIMAMCAALGIIFELKIAYSCMRQSAPLGATFTFLALMTGSLWGKPMWGTWWIWDARLTSELILLFLYVGVLLFQSAIGKKKSADKTIAILVLFGFIDIPIIHYSVYWWNTLHQPATFKLFAASTIDHSMAYPLFAMTLAFISYYLLLLVSRVNYEYVISQNNRHWIR